MEPMESGPVFSSRPTPAAPIDAATIGKSLVIKGEVTGSEELHIDGRIEGCIGLAGNRVTVGKSGSVAADIAASEIVILGTVCGNLVAAERVDIRSEGSLTGDVVAARIVVEEGAFLKGHVDIRKPTHTDRSAEGGLPPASAST
jgi:cytoskeletal protein CcmA (bactofilin family)